MLRFFNTLSGQLEEFRSAREGEVGLYFCGPTVWNYAHIGNLRSLGVFGDTLRRYLKYKGYRLTHVMNITDVDDRIIDRAREEGVSLDEYTARYIEAMWEDFDAIGCERPDIAPRATQHIAEMVDIVERLLEHGHAYHSEGSYYYRINSFPE